MWRQINLVLLALGLTLVLTPSASAREDEEVVKDIDHAWVKLFDTRDYQGERLSINYPKTIRDFRRMDTDRGRKDSGNNIAQSAHYAIPKGWALRLYTGADFKGDSVDLVGTNRPERKVLPSDVANKISSARWVRVDRDRDDERDWRWERRDRD